MTKRSLVIVFLFFSITKTGFAQQSTNPGHIERPKLVVGLVVDQMRWDYLYRYSSLYGSNGFNRLTSQGNSCENTFIPYTPTYTAVGHSCIYTGSIPSISGIVGNNWFDRSTGKTFYCTDDSTVNSVGTTTNEGKMSPANLWVTTIGDELRLHNNFKSKVIGVAIKDRASILPAGHAANAAYWYDDMEGKIISSSYYMKELPGWVQDFNKKDLVNVYMSKDWNTILPLSSYDLSSGDNMKYESTMPEEKLPVFPHRTSLINKQKAEAFKYTPFAATYTFDFAKAAIENENLGNSVATDFLTISISSTDYVGHTYGPNSIEAEDAFLRLDKDIESFLQYLDKRLGKGNYTVFLTADHGVAHIPGFLQSHNIPAGNYNSAAIHHEIDSIVKEKLGINNAILSFQNYQVYLNTEEIEKQQKDINAVKEVVIDILKQKPFILNVIDLSNAATATIAEPMRTRIINGYNMKRSGDIQFVTKANYFDGTSGTGTTHGSWNPYDSHIPLVWYGWGIRQGRTNRETYMTDIAATLAAILRIQMPGGCVGNVITEVMK